MTSYASVTSADGGSFSAYIQEPRNSGKVPGLVLLHQIFGVTDEMKSFTDEFADAGYLSICPDLYWRLGSNTAIDPLSENALQRAVSYGRMFDTEKGIADLSATVAFLRSHPRSSGKVGTVGYCLGGLMAFLLSARGQADCNVGYFGTGIERRIDEAEHLARPLLLHIPEKDHIVPPAAQAIIRKHLVGKAAIFTYPDADHAFNRRGAETYNPEVAMLAHERTLAFLHMHLVID